MIKYENCKEGVVLFSEIVPPRGEKWCIMTYRFNDNFRISASKFGEPPIFTIYKKIYKDATELHYFVCEKIAEGDYASLPQ